MGLERPGEVGLAGEAVAVGDLADIQARSPWAAQQVMGLLQALPTDRELEMLRQQRIRFDGFFTGPTW